MGLRLKLPFEFIGIYCSVVISYKSKLLLRLVTPKVIITKNGVVFLQKLI